MNSAYKVFRSIILSALALAIGLPVLALLALAFSPVQNRIRCISERELSSLLGVEVKIGELSIAPFNKVKINNVSVVGDGDTILKVETLGAGLNANELLHKRLALNYVELIGLDARLSRDSLGAPLNIDPIVARLKKPDDGNPKKPFDIRINTVVIRNSRIRYDVRSAEQTPGRFNPAHIAVDDLRADVSLPAISNDEYRVNLRRLSFAEQSGFTVEGISGAFSLDSAALAWKDFRLALPESEIAFADATITAAEGSTVAGRFDSEGIPVHLRRGSHIFLPDLRAFAEPLGDIRSTVAFNLDSRISRSKISVAELSAADRGGDFVLDVKNLGVEHYTSPDSIEYSLDRILFNAGGSTLSRVKRLGIVNDRRFDALDGLHLTATASGSALRGRLSGDADINDGSLKLDADYARAAVGAPFKVNAKLVTDNLDLAAIADSKDFDRLNADIEAEATVDGSLLAVDANVTVTGFRFRDNVYDEINASAIYNDGDFTGDALISDNAVNASLSVKGSARKGAERLVADLTLEDADLHRLGFIKAYEGYRLSMQARADLAGSSPDRLDGFASVYRLKFAGQDGRTFGVDSLTVTSSSSELPRSLEVKSPLINGYIKGDYRFRTLPATAAAIFAKALPELLPEQSSALAAGIDEDGNDFDYFFKIERTEKLADFFKLPVDLIFPATIEGRFNGSESYADLNMSLPYISQKNKLITETNLKLVLDGAQAEDALHFASKIPTKNGEMDMKVMAVASDNRLLTDIDWKIDNAKQYEGSVSLNSLLGRSENGDVAADIGIRPSRLVFNDSVWALERARILVDGLNKIRIDNINAHRSNQFVKIDGTVSKDEADTLKVDVLNLSLDYLFETLAIENVMLGGDATGEISASSLLSGAPHLVTEGIRVKDIGYNGCRFGDAVVKSHWDNDNKAVALDGLISQYNGRQARIAGEILPLSSELDLRFDVDKTPVGFLHKYMGTFADDISGYASGHARLWGNFHDIDLEGDLFADNLRLKLIPTNTYYTATDSVHIVPGLIKLHDITLRDVNGKSAKLNGEVRHEFFRDPTFDIRVTGADDLLAYQETSKDNPDWYGTVYVDGGVTVVGDPGIVKVTVNATTAPNSIFTFVLSQKQVADEYTFLTFRDKGKLNAVVEETEVDADTAHLKKFLASIAKKDETQQSDYIIEFNVGVTPEAEIDLVMDPVSGDKIRAHGSGDIRMIYTSKDNDLRMFGTYTLDKGTYTFTLQDIIIKEFTINQGSSITFTGDPMAARLDINAFYSLNANLSDLDESFLQDRDLNRTNVPVHAILMVKGDINQPEISFDLAFPSLTSDVYRKVRSIVSTDEMMNRQIIYLLALNRFYTPDYMGSSSRGSSELFSVASSTITSQLSNILGQLSENWAISPNLRSDRGDFSDVEIDVALSSRLLNNRLLFNGNFGYRDKSLNTNQFIGDFDLEYLLNRRGTIRLKAYSHFNDQNYYVRTAQTTQGAGVAFKFNFDNFLDPFRLHKKSAPSPAALSPTPAAASPTPSDTIPAAEATEHAPAESGAK